MGASERSFCPTSQITNKLIWTALRTEKGSNSVTSWNTDSSRLNSQYLRIARQAKIASNPPQSRPISQERLEKSARETLVFCNQAACFSCCLLKVQQNMQTKLKTIRTESEGKSGHGQKCNQVGTK